VSQVSPCAPRGKRIIGVTAEDSGPGPPLATAGFTAHLETSQASLRVGRRGSKSGSEGEEKRDDARIHPDRP